MNEERLKFQGRLAEAELEAKRVKIVADGLINSLRNLLDPFCDLTELSAEQIVDQALRLGNQIAAYREELAKIAALNKMLGK
jgi:hypothetical protein